MRSAAVVLALWSAASEACARPAPRVPDSPPPPECSAQVEVVRVTPADAPKVAHAESVLAAAGVRAGGVDGAVATYEDGTCQDLYNPRGSRCGWHSVTVPLEDAARARAVLSAGGVPVVPETDAASFAPSPGLVERCTRSK
jgi:hypothetical protein